MWRMDESTKECIKKCALAFIKFSNTKKDDLWRLRGLKCYVIKVHTQINRHVRNIIQTCMASENYDHPAHSRSQDSQGLKIRYMDNEASQKTARMRRLIRAFVGRTCQK